MAKTTNLAGRMISGSGGVLAQDRLGSVVRSGTETLRYFPWGEERVTTTQNRDKFATYFGDSTGLDYALNRYYSSSHGRFLTPDPAEAGVTGLPQSFNSYCYALSDPVNLNDPDGLDPVVIPPLQPVSQPQCVTRFAEATAVMGLSLSQYFNSQIGILGVTTWFENQGYTESVVNSWIGMGWTFVNRYNLSDADKRKYGFTTSPDFRDVILQPNQSQVWSNGQLKAGFQTQLIRILAGSPDSQDCQGLALSLNTAARVLNTAAGNMMVVPAPNPVGNALFFASGKAIPRVHTSFSLEEVTTIDGFTFYRLVEKPEPPAPRARDDWDAFRREPVAGGRAR